MKCIVYVLRNPDGKFYIGQTAELEHRIEQHNAGLSRWTKNKGPWCLLWASEPLSRKSARAVESKLKRQKGGDGFYKITGLRRSVVNPAAAGSYVRILPEEPVLRLDSRC